MHTNNNYKHQVLLSNIIRTLHSKSYPGYEKRLLLVVDPVIECAGK
jgi:hypothetical protein